MVAILCLNLYHTNIHAVIVTPRKITIYQTDIVNQQNQKFDNTNKAENVSNCLFITPKKRLTSYVSANRTLSKNVHINFSCLKYSPTIQLNMFKLLNRTATRERIEYRSADDFTWFGSVDPSRGIDSILTVKGQALRGNVVIDNHTYHISPISPPLHRVAQIDYSDYPKEHPPIELSTTIQKDQPVTDLYQNGDDGSVIHTMVLYTKKAAQKSNGISTLIQLSMDETNLSFENSDIQTRLNLVHTHQVEHVEQDMVSDLNYLAGRTDGYMDYIHALRDQYCADIVVLLTSSNNYCGVSYLNPDPDHAFCVVSYKCATGYYSFGHEIGHLFGARHNPEVDNKSHPYPYGHGYLHVNGWRTIMAYNSAAFCPDGICERIMYWSNPNKRYNKTYMGTFSTHNNARLLNESAIRLANFRYFGKGFTVYNNQTHSLTIEQISPKFPWLKLSPLIKTPFELTPQASQSFKLFVDWQNIQSSEANNISIKTQADAITIAVTAIPSDSVSTIAVSPDTITCSMNISILNFEIDDSQHSQMKWHAFSTDPWLSIIHGHSGNGTGSVSLRVSQNPMGMRIGHVTVMPMRVGMPKYTVHVRQTGNPLMLELPAKVKESDGILSDAANVSVPFVLDADLKVQLVVSDASEISIPTFVIIPQGEKSVRFGLTIIDDTEPDGPQNVKVNAIADGWFSGEAFINVLDDESNGIIYVGKNQMYETIQSAIMDSASDNTIIVQPGTYTENIVIDKPIHLCSQAGPAQTIIQAQNNSEHVIEISHSHTVIEGFSIMGADNYGNAAIYLSKTANHCFIINNICGTDATHTNFYGIYVNSSGFHSLSKNLCQHNRRYGIYLDQSHDNALIKNTCQLNQRTGLYLFQSSNNRICKNTLQHHPKYGLNLKYNSNNNLLFLNAFINNDSGHVYSKWSTNRWQTTLPVNYLFESQRWQGFLGNYFDDHLMSDHNTDGITDAFYQLPDKEPLALYPLSEKPDTYESFIQIAARNNQLLPDEQPQMQNKYLCASEESVAFISILKKNHAWSLKETDAWTGNLRFTQPVRCSHQIKLELGYSDENNDFIAIGKPFIFKGDSKTRDLNFCYFPGAFTITNNQQFTFQLTNESPTDYTLLLGGGHTHISPYRHDHAYGHQWTVGKDNLFRTITFALDSLSSYQLGSMNSDLTIMTMPGNYPENIQIKHPISLVSADGYTRTQISAKRNDIHALHIRSDRVTISGFTITGAHKFNKAGICIDSGVTKCKILKNRMINNDYGMIIRASTNNVLLQNKCIANEKHGIWMDIAFMNHVAHNRCFQNQDAGIFMSHGLQNCLEHNVFENNFRGVYLSQSSRNHIQHNTFDSNTRDGLHIASDSINNLIFLNNFVLNRYKNVQVHGHSRWQSPWPITYQYKENIFTSHLGNHYADFNGADHDHNGVIDLPHQLNQTEQLDIHPLKQSFTAYTLIEPPKTSLQTNKPSDKQAIATNTVTVDESTPYTENEIVVHNKNHFVQLKKAPAGLQQTEKESSGYQQVEQLRARPILVFLNVPDYGNRLKNLKGLVLNVSPEYHHIAVYTHIDGRGWQSKPYPSAPMTPIDKNGHWECDITTAAFDQNADEIVAVLYEKQIIPPTLMNAPALPDAIFEKGVGFTRVVRVLKKSEVGN